MSWFGILEKRLVDALLRSPAFTRGVQNIHKRVHTLQHGKPPEYHSPTQLDGEEAVQNGGLGRFFKLFWDELKQGHRPEALSNKPPPSPPQVRDKR
ncbi:uncharacterized protein HMPREF1541_06227 [Cyphellophora europaea CBS 101466]|uniref:Uncharacterized protein n=1 Tax=Cyphellophora europaea (strain CBS 101466) TaxID=1220924 RepID=W2RNT5_CYPE1|nr:uncharacterized protein HMPREF1541_06227 [Cyphellophora europaea CBS 101466]ETN38196.1 hypothetical protein HMPREF1541_06227 [Cyphellophora europaea CBS 101466]